MSIDLFFEYFYNESRGLLEDISRLAWELRSVDIPDEREAKQFADCTQKLHRLIGGMASIGFGMYAAASHKTSVIAERGAKCAGISIKSAVTAIYIIVVDISVYFTSMAKVKEVEVLAPKIEKLIDDCMSICHVSAVDLTSQDEIDDIMKLFGNV